MVTNYVSQVQRLQNRIKQIEKQANTSMAEISKNRDNYMELAGKAARLAQTTAERYSAIVQTNLAIVQELTNERERSAKLAGEIRELREKLNKSKRMAKILVKT